MRNFFNEAIIISKLFISMIRALVVSEKIYYDILKNYKGYGLKFSSIVIFITTLISTFGFFINLEIFEFNLNKPHSKDLTNLDYILNQFPEPIYYNGESISFTNDDKIILVKNSIENTVIAFDVNNKINTSNKKNIPIIFKKSEILFPKMDYITSIKYKNISIKEEKIISIPDIKKFVNESISSLKDNIIFSIPIIFVIKFLDYFIENALIVILLYSSCKLFKINFLLKDIIRVILFASAPSVLLSSIILFLNPSLIFLASFLKIFCLFFIYKTITNIRSK